MHCLVLRLVDGTIAVSVGEQPIPIGEEKRVCGGWSSVVGGGSELEYWGILVGDKGS